MFCLFGTYLCTKCTGEGLFLPILFLQNGFRSISLNNMYIKCVCGGEGVGVCFVSSEHIYT